MTPPEQRRDNPAATRPFRFISAKHVKKSSDFSINTLTLLNGATFADLDAAEKRLLLAGYQAGLLATMTQEARAAIAYLEDHAGAIRREREASK